MTEEELKAKVDEIIKRTRNQDVVDYADVDTLIMYIDLLEYKASLYQKSMNRIESELGIQEETPNETTNIR